MVRIRPIVFGIKDNCPFRPDFLNDRTTLVLGPSPNSRLRIVVILNGKITLPFRPSSNGKLFIFFLNYTIIYTLNF
jgi:hypothetical protein